MSHLIDYWPSLEAINHCIRTEAETPTNLSAILTTPSDSSSTAAGTTSTFARLLSSAALQGMRNAMAVFMQSLSEGRVIERPDLQSSFEDLNALMGHARIKELEARFVTAADIPSRAAE